MSLFRDRVRETSTTTGAGDMTLSASAPTNFRTFQQAFTVGDIVPYTIVHQAANEWEVGEAPLSSATTIQRSAGAVYASSNAGALVNFSGGTKDVFCSIPAIFAEQTIEHGEHCAVMQCGAYQ